MKKIDISDLLFHALVPIILGSMIGFIFKDYTSYLEELDRTIVVPRIVFPVVWSILYLLIGIWYHFFSQTALKKDKIIYYVGLGINLLFTPVLFYFENIPLAFLIVIVLLIINIYLLFKSTKDSKKGYLLVPYILWLCFASVLMIDLLINNVL